MPVYVTSAGQRSATIAWEPQDDPHGWLSRAVESDQLSYALEALGDGETEHDTSRQADAALQAAHHTMTIARLLEARVAAQVVRLRDAHGLSWRRIAETLHGDPDKQSSVRRQYEAGLRQLGR
ncbi:hypothetical protein [Kitasatospora sp. NPDC047058]|uniref:hypothetical protein n=1 Tax=Kitasatospora sp. NPDC047058 TaxID=3155620 RepID=UPI00340CB114